MCIESWTVTGSSKWQHFITDLLFPWWCEGNEDKPIREAAACRWPPTPTSSQLNYGLGWDDLLRCYTAVSADQQSTLHSEMKEEERCRQYDLSNCFEAAWEDTFWKRIGISVQGCLNLRPLTGVDHIKLPQCIIQERTNILSSLQPRINLKKFSLSTGTMVLSEKGWSSYHVNIHIYGNYSVAFYIYLYI